MTVETPPEVLAAQKRVNDAQAAIEASGIQLSGAIDPMEPTPLYTARLLLPFFVAAFDLNWSLKAWRSLEELPPSEQVERDIRCADAWARAMRKVVAQGN